MHVLPGCTSTGKSFISVSSSATYEFTPYEVLFLLLVKAIASSFLHSIKNIKLYFLILIDIVLY